MMLDKEAFSYLSIKIPKVQNYKKKKINGYVMRWDAKKIIRGGLFQYEYSQENRMLNIYGTVEGATKLDEKDIVATIDYDYNFVIKENNLGFAEDIVKLDIRYMNLETTKKDTIDWDLIKVPDIKIPRSQAREYKKNYKDAFILGYKQLKKDMTNYEYFNMHTIHPTTGSKFIIGLQKDIDRAPVLAEKKSIVPPDLV